MCRGTTDEHIEENARITRSSKEEDGVCVCEREIEQERDMKTPTVIWTSFIEDVMTLVGFPNLLRFFFLSSF